MALTEMVIMPGEDYQAICDSVRAKTGATELLKSGEVSKAIDGIETGGGIDTSSDTPAEAGHIIEGRVAYVNGEKVTGEMQDLWSDAWVNAREDVSGCSISDDGNGTNRLVLEGRTTNSLTKYAEPETRIRIYLPENNPRMSVFGDASIEDVASGKTFTSSKGFVVTGTHVCKEGLDTSTDTPAEEGDIVKGKVAFANGEGITGTMEAMSGLSTLMSANEDSSVISNDDGSKSLLLSGKYSGTNTRYVEPNTSLYILMEDANDKMSMFGNATIEDVVQGKTFTSAAGFAVTGSIEAKTASDVTSSGATVSVPAGYYASNVSKSVNTATQATPSISVDSDGLITATSVQSAGYVAAGTTSSTKKDPNLVAENIKSGVTIFGVAGTLSASSGSSEGQYCWKKYPVSNGYEVTTKSLGTTKPSDCGSASYSSYTITDEGYFQLASGTSTLTYYYLPTGAKNGKTKYIYLKAWKYAASGSYYLYSKLTLSDTPTQTIGDLVGYVVSDVSDTYPSDGDGGDGYWYTLVS